MRLADFATLAVDELGYARESARVADYDSAAAHALVSIAASLYRLQAIPPRLPFDPLDMHPAEPPESEDERYWTDKTDRRLDRD